MRLTRWIALLGLMVAAFGLIAPVAAQETPVVKEMQADPGQFLERCLSAGYSEQECRRLYDELHDSPLEHFAERCLGAGYTPQECRRLYNALFGEDRPLAERCRAAGLTIEECRRLMLAYGDSDLAVRCRAAGLTVEECRRLAGEDPLQTMTRDQLQTQTQAGAQTQTQAGTQTQTGPGSESQGQTRTGRGSRP